MDYRPEDYSKYRLQRAHDTIKEVEVLIENRFWNSAINRMYYACFYAVGALLVLNGIETASHSGMRQKLGQLFVKTGEIDRDLGKHYSELFEKRHKGDYNDFFDYDEDTVLRLLPKSKELINAISKLIDKSIIL
ncbi:HEPN domain-containing protein [Plebeiibacterium sediminum]|uniref:HEPN domain-containing protein n=1 Tax=Plebeiibacterium sediminum TaxID=2992112 RepID=A0AAE3M683_9BACT|nr:HEPN domain-containing protein [Plebeiobacterium sediminum]MCW3787375.1 HEPN domain-containing protein [Plebeiobacterium sediminum]